MKCLRCGFEMKKKQNVCPVCDFDFLEVDEDSSFTKEMIFSDDKTLVDLRNRLAAISDDEVLNEIKSSKKNKDKKNKINDDELESTQERKLLDEMEKLSKTIEQVDREIVEEREEIDKIKFSNAINERNFEDNNDDYKISDTKEFVNLEKTIAISLNQDTKELDSLSLIDDINDQIENINSQSEEMDSLNYKEDEIKQELSMKDSNEESVKKSRNKIFIITGAVIITFILTVVFFFAYVPKNNFFESSNVNYVDKMNVAMQKYYETEDIDDIIFILNEIKDDEEQVKELQTKTRTICDSWVLLYLNEELENVEGFENATIKYKNLVERLYSNAIAKSGNKTVRALTEKDRDDLIKQFDDIYSDSAMFYDALDLYNKKEYNDAYYLFNRIGSENYYYEKSVTYCNNIIDEIIEFINNDITKLESNIDTLNNDDKLKRYTTIEQIIIDYANVYFNIPLDDDVEYQRLLSKYTSKVSEYSVIVQDADQGVA